MHKELCCHLLSQIVFKILIRVLVRMAQGIEYDSLSILRIDDKYNPVAHDSPATQLKQYWYANGEKHKKSQLKHSKYRFNLPELVRGKDTPIVLNLLHGF